MARLCQPAGCPGGAAHPRRPRGRAATASPAPADIDAGGNWRSAFPSVTSSCAAEIDGGSAAPPACGLHGCIVAGGGGGPCADIVGGPSPAHDRTLPRLKGHDGRRNGAEVDMGSAPCSSRPRSIWDRTDAPQLRAALARDERLPGRRAVLSGRARISLGGRFGPARAPPRRCGCVGSGGRRGGKRDLS